ncbi:MAG: hypothetical protein IKD50_08015, partial [Clostridia bacterium]|nr:hypothetical protein [Clostridia bacterium]
LPAESSSESFPWGVSCSAHRIKDSMAAIVSTPLESFKVFHENTTEKQQEEVPASSLAADAPESR